MRRILSQCLVYFVFAGIFSIFINTLYLTFSIYMLAVYDGVLSSYSFPTLYVVTFLALLALLVLGCLDFIRSRILVKAGVKIDKLLSRKVLKRMLRDLCRSDSLQYSQGLKDVIILRNFLGGNSIFAFFDAPWIFIYLAIIYLVHPVLGFTATGGAVITLVLGLLQNSLTLKDIEKAEEKKDQNKKLLEKSFRTAATVKSMGMLTPIAVHWSRTNDKAVAFQDKAGNISQILGAASQSFGQMMQVVIFGVGAMLVLMNQTGSGVIIAASIIMGRALSPINQAISAWRQTSEAKSAYKRLKKLMDSAPDTGQIRVEGLQGRLSLENVGLAIGNRQIIKDIHFKLDHGELMGMIGPNGAGKTSLCRLILGMWTPSEGRVLLDNIEVFLLDQDSLGPCIGYLPQAVELFPGTVAENIARMGTVDFEKVVLAAKDAGAHDLILRFPLGYETEVGEAGLNLSGGQRQRVGLARALYGNPGLVILDEPNSNLDEEGEQALIRALGRMKEKGVTVIMITHKSSLLYTVDKMLVLSDGRMSGFGDRDQIFGQIINQKG
jgi:PrtD family type I secretion system ABC transporter